MSHQDEKEATQENESIARANLEADLAQLNETGEGFEPLY